MFEFRTIALIVAVLASIWIVISIYKYVKERKSGGPQQKSWLLQVGVAFVALVVSCLLYYFKFHHSKKGSVKNGTTQ
jgi:chromate transport protein ChrA